MPRIGVFFGSTDGNTARVAEQIKERFDALLLANNEECVELIDIAEYELATMLDFDCLILGVPTWNTGQLQRDWEATLEEFDALDLRGKCAAIFGLGDQAGYPATFADAMIFVVERIQACGATLVGAWSSHGYRFDNSWALRPDGQFVGLVLDEHNQPEQTEARLDQWTAQLWQAFGECNHEH